MFKPILSRVEKKVTELSGAEYRPVLFSFHTLLIAGSFLYSAGIRLRSFVYRLGLLPRKSLPCPVVSIGNVVAGGAGKTPMTIYIAKLLRDLGMRPVVVSRGYKGRFKGDSAVVGNGEQVFLNAETAGDEPFMMASLKQFPVVIGKDRYSAGMKAVHTFDPDLILLDDAFQHLQLERDVDLVLTDYSNPLGNRRLLPAGRLREPFDNARKRMDALIFTRSASKGLPDSAASAVIRQISGIPWFKCFHVPFLTCIAGKSEPPESPEPPKSLDDLKGKKALLVSALADNTSFYRSMAESGIIILEHLEFKDHYRYKKADILKINKTAENKGACIILTTQKDWVKLSDYPQWKMDVGVIGVEICFEKSDSFTSFIKERCLHL